MLPGFSALFDRGCYAASGQSGRGREMSQEQVERFAAAAFATSLQLDMKEKAQHFLTHFLQRICNWTNARKAQSEIQLEPRVSSAPVTWTHVALKCANAKLLL